MAHLGLIGGIGPAATIEYYKRLTDLARAAKTRLELTIANADTSTLVANNLADERAGQAEIFARHIAQLKAAGATHAAITSLGGHFCFDETVALSSLPLVSGVTPLDDHFAAESIGKIGLLGTDVVMRTRLYGQLSKTEAVIPEDTKAIGALYLEMATSGHCSDETRATFFAEGEKLIKRGAEVILLAGTDLGLAFAGRDPGYPVLDALDIHVSVLFDLVHPASDKAP